MKTNVKTKSTPIFTAEGGLAKRTTNENALRRTVLSHFLWEDNFYQDGQAVVDRIKTLVPLVDATTVSNIAIECREKQKLRHVPLKIVREMVRHNSHKGIVADTLERVIQRPDELTEFLSLYWKDKKDAPLANSVKKGLARAFTKFNAYSLAKYNRDADIKLKDVLFLCHAKPNDAEQANVWKKLINNTLETPDTWEVELSAGKGENKKESWERLLKENKLGALALLRNLRNMQEVGVDDILIKNALNKCNPERVLPFRFISAARYAPKFEPELESLMFKCLNSWERLEGRTCIIVDVSGSMNGKLSDKSELTRLDAANGVAMIARQICSDVDVYTFSDRVVVVPSRKGFALAEAITNSQPHSSTNLSIALTHVRGKYDRAIVITDKQTQSSNHPTPGNKNYLINVACNRNGIGYGKWTHIDGWSEAVVDFILETEKTFQD